MQYIEDQTTHELQTSAECDASRMLQCTRRLDICTQNTLYGLHAASICVNVDGFTIQ